MSGASVSSVGGAVPSSVSLVGIPRSGTLAVATPKEPLVLERGETLTHAELAFERFGPDEPERIVLICHALTGDAHVTRQDPNDPAERTGWWEALVGSGRAVDTATTAVLCANVLGGCDGSTGPASTRPTGDRPFGPDFPRITIGDMVETQRRLLVRLGVPGPVTVIGGSIGGFQALEWIRRFPDEVAAAAVIAAGTSLSPFGIAFNTVGRSAIRNDPRFHGGQYTRSAPPTDGLAAARQLAHLTYRTPRAFDHRFGRRKADPADTDIRSHDDFEVQSYLTHKGRSFASRFDANTYIRLTEAMDSYDADEGGTLADRLGRFGGRLLAVGYSSDWLFTPEQSLALATIAQSAGVQSRALILDTDNGHDAFLMPHDGLTRAVRDLLDEVHTT